MNGWRGLLAPTIVARARLRRQRGRNLLLVAGIGAAVAMLVGVLGGSLVARDLSLRSLVTALPRNERSFRVDLNGLPSQGTHDAAARAALARLTSARPLRLVAFRDFRLQGELVRFAGLDGLGSFVRVTSGRLPRRCDPRVCEVLQIGGRGLATLREGGISLVRVGEGRLVDPARFGTTFLRLQQERAQRSHPRTFLLFGPSSDAVERLPSVSLLLRLRSWLAPVDARRIHVWEIGSVLRRETQTQAMLEQADPSLVLAGPDSALLSARQRGDTYARRVLLVGGSAAVALFSFTVLAAAGLSRGLAAERRRLVQRGASRIQLLVALLAEVGAIVAVGWAVGIGLGAAAIAALASAEGLPAEGVLVNSLWTSTAVLALGGILVLALVLVAWAASAEDSGEPRRRVRLLDVVALGAVLAIVTGMSRGTPSGTFLLLLPLLVFLAGGLLVARLLGPLTMLAERLARRGSVAVRLALLALARAPGRTAAACAFIATATGLVVFASAYRSTLERGAKDEASFAVPLDYTVSESSHLVLPLDAAPLQGYERLAPGVRAYSVLRRSADAAGAGTSTQSATILGVPSAAFAVLRWRSDYSARSQAELARAIRWNGSPSLAGARLPPDAALRLPVRARGPSVAVDLVLQEARGRIQTVALGTAKGATVMRARAPRQASRIVALEVSLSNAARAWFFHLANERRLILAPSGSLELAPLLAGGRTVTDWHGWIVRGPGQGEGERISYSFPNADTIVFRPRLATDDRPLPIIASPEVAAAAGPGGLVTLNFYDPPVQARVVATARRFPTIGAAEPFAVADEAALSTTLNADAPGTGMPGELWLSTPGRSSDLLAHGLTRPPFSLLTTQSRGDLAEQARSDPLARGAVYTLGVAALVALVLAIIGLWTTVVGDVRDERDALFDLEAQGAGPETLRRHLRLRALGLMGFGVAGGCALGFVLSRLVVSLVKETAAATEPVLPLVTDLGTGTLAIALAALVVGALALVEATVRQAFRADVPERTSWSSE